MESGEFYRAVEECTRPHGFLSAAINAKDIWTQMTRWSWHVEPPKGEWGSVHDKYNFVTLSYHAGVVGDWGVSKRTKLIYTLLTKNLLIKPSTPVAFGVLHVVDGSTGFQWTRSLFLLFIFMESTLYSLYTFTTCPYRFCHCE